MKVYTFNDKVLVNSANDKWLKKAAPPPFEVTIGNQTWKTVYLNIDDGQGGIDYNSDTGLYYYTPAAASRVAATINGWHLPSKDEVDTLIGYVGRSNMAKLISVDDEGTDDYGLGLRLAGMKYGPYSYVGTYGYLITTTYGYLFNSSYAQWYSSSVRQGNVRLIKDS